MGCPYLHLLLFVNGKTLRYVNKYIIYDNFYAHEGLFLVSKKGKQLLIYRMKIYLSFIDNVTNALKCLNCAFCTIHNYWGIIKVAEKNGITLDKIYGLYWIAISAMRYKKIHEALHLLKYIKIWHNPEIYNCLPNYNESLLSIAITTNNKLIILEVMKKTPNKYIISNQEVIIRHALQIGDIAVRTIVTFNFDKKIVAEIIHDRLKKIPMNLDKDRRQKDYALVAILTNYCAY